MNSVHPSRPALGHADPAGRDKQLSQATATLAPMNEGARIIDATVRFLRTNPKLVAYARSAAGGTGRTVDELLADAARRYASALERVAEQEVVAGAAR